MAFLIFLFLCLNFRCLPSFHQAMPKFEKAKKAKVFLNLIFEDEKFQLGYKIFTCVFSFLLFFKYIKNAFFALSFSVFGIFFNIFYQLQKRYLFLHFSSLFYLSIYLALLPKILFRNKSFKNKINLNSKEPVVVMIGGRRGYISNVQKKFKTIDYTDVFFIKERPFLLPFNKLIKIYSNQIEKGLLNESFISGERELIFYGHSMGGAMVIAIVNELLKKYPNLKITIIVDNTYTKLSLVASFLFPKFPKKVIDFFLHYTFGDVNSEECLKNLKTCKIYGFFCENDKVLGPHSLKTGKDNLLIKNNDSKDGHSNCIINFHLLKGACVRDFFVKLCQELENAEAMQKEELENAQAMEKEGLERLLNK